MLQLINMIPNDQPIYHLRVLDEMQWLNFFSLKEKKKTEGAL